MPYLVDPLAPIPSEQPICPEDPAETFKVCTPKPIHDLWLYTARPIAVNVDEVVSRSHGKLLTGVSSNEVLRGGVLFCILSVRTSLIMQYP